MSDSTNSSSVPMVPVPLRSLLAGRLRNITGGKPRHWFMAVAEAVQNAIDAIEQSGRPGSATIVLERSPLLITDGSAIAPVTTVVVRDTGAGFNSQNFESFCTPDSLLKHRKGGKGLGRLVCLQTFERIEGRSLYQNGNGMELREFVLQRGTPELAGRTIHHEAGDAFTEIRLVGLRSDFATAAAVETSALVDWLIDHFLPFFLEKPAWLESVNVVDGGKPVNLTARVSGGAIWTETFQVKSYEFKTACYRSGHEDDIDRVRWTPIVGQRIG